MSTSAQLDGIYITPELGGAASSRNSRDWRSGQQAGEAGSAEILRSQVRHRGRELSKGQEPREMLKKSIFQKFRWIRIDVSLCYVGA